MPETFVFDGSKTVQKSLDENNRNDKTEIEDVGMALLTRPRDSSYEEPEEQRSTGFFSKFKAFKSILSNLTTSTGTAMEASSNVIDFTPVLDKKSDGKVETEDESDMQHVDEETESERNHDKDLKIDSSDDAEFYGELSSEAADYIDEDIETSHIVDEDFITFKDDFQQEQEANEDHVREDTRKPLKLRKDEWKSGLSQAQARTKAEELIEELSIIKTIPRWFKGGKSSKDREYSGDSLAQILQEEILDFVDYVSPSKDEHRIRKYAIRLIADVVYAVFPDSQLFVFGSFQSHLYLPQSDIDLVILTDIDLGKNLSKYHKLANALKKRKVAEKCQVIGARIPIVKFVETFAGLSVDISINADGGIRGAAYTNGMISNYKALKPMTIVMKQFLQMRGMNEVFSGGLGSFGLCAIIINFLQLHPRIQSGEILQEENLGVLLMEFLDLYGKRFNYDRVGISIRNSGSYFVKGRLGNLSNERAGALTVEDPLDTSNDITKGTFNMKQIATSFSYAYDILASAIYEQFERQRRYKDFKIKSFLGTILAVDDQIAKHREQRKKKIHKVPDNFDEEYIEGFVPPDSNSSNDLESQEEIVTSHRDNKRKKRKRMAEDEDDLPRKGKKRLEIPDSEAEEQQKPKKKKKKNKRNKRKKNKSSSNE